MKNKTTYTFLIIACLAFNGLFAQGVNFFEGKYKDALAEAAKRNVPLFIDFYADWCAPCKMMDKKVYTDSELGAYFNENFVSVKVDVEEELNADLVKEHQIRSMPTLLFVDANEKVLSKVSGSLDIENLTEMAKTVTGDEKSFEDIYDAYKDNKDDLAVMSELLNKAPAFVSLQEGMDKKKWITRVERIFNDYIDVKIAKGDDALVNKEDYIIIKKFHNPKDQDDKIMEYIVDHLDGYIEKVGEPVAFYVIQYNNDIANNLAKKGDKEYMQHLERIKGDMKPAYNVLDGDNEKQYQLAKTNSDALYALFKENDTDKYITLKNEYFELQGDKVSPMGLARAAQIIYSKPGNKVTKEQNEAAKEWIIESLQAKNIPTMERVNIMALLGDVYKSLGDLTSAQKTYNQAYIESAKIDRVRMQKYIQMLLKRKIELLKLE
ncbi:thioredoxin family protein [Galbibacter mesophilus]|uniref:thioredoxin family protein n=1 Tax=Galbibacter mesophilus TaxID=379069 RepID=UPI00191EF0AA|nr:thioredoxin family protein [Galbibacter mesophilus]MCM5662654.1 thioredoxin family protein [Galbibacter mesophilus]